MARVRLVHLSDPHLGPLPQPSFGDLISKRFFGYVNWRRHRRHSQSGSVIEALMADIAAQNADHIAVTGDLVNIALEAEFSTGAAFLARLGDGAHVSCVPGNHDAYVPGALRSAQTAWAPYMCGDDGRVTFPFVRVVGGVALIGVSTALATPPLSARGQVGRSQVNALHALLDRYDDAFKVVLIHHPPDPDLTPFHRRLADHQAVRAALSAGCADLILHGHNHRASQVQLATGRGSAPIIGVPSAGSDGSRYPPAGYAIYDIDPDARTVTMTRRAISSGSGAFETVARTALAGEA